MGKKGQWCPDEIQSAIMLPKSRILSALFTGLGIALIVGGLAAPRFLNGDGRLPLGLEDITWTLSDPDGSYLGEPAPVTRQLHLEVRNPSDETSASIRVGESLRAGTAGADFDNLVSASVWAFGMDRDTGVPTTPLELSHVMVMPPIDVDLQSPWLKLPSDTEQKSYEVFDSTLRKTAEANFTGEEDIKGRRVHRFEQVVEPTNLAMNYADARNTKIQVDEEGNQARLFLNYGVQRELLVDHISGLVVGLNESVDMYYADGSGQRVEDFVSYSAEMPMEQTEGMLNQLGAVFSAGQSRRLTTGIIILGAVVALAGLIGAFRPVVSSARRRGRHGLDPKRSSDRAETAQFRAVDRKSTHQ